MQGDGGWLTRTPSERLTWPLTVAGDLQNAGPHSGGRPLTRTEEARGSNPLTSTPPAQTLVIVMSEASRGAA
jgi:hypothetical protein